MRSWVMVAALVLAARAQAAPCRDNYWQPTYVHDLVRPDGQPWYVMPDGRFVPVAPPYEINGAQLCERYGVRDARGFTSCRDYPRVQCGCDGASGGNATCRAFLYMRAQLAQQQQPQPLPYQPPPQPPQPQLPYVQPPQPYQQPPPYQPPPQQPYVPPPPAAPAGLVDTISVPSDRGDPVYSRVTLEAGRPYTIEVSGVFSCWNDHTDGVDGFYCYAKWRCPEPQVWGQLQVDDRALSDVAKENGETLALHGDHVYATRVIGSGRPVKLQIADARNSAGDNHGHLTVRIFARGPRGPVPRR